MPPSSIDMIGSQMNSEVTSLRTTDANSGSTSGPTRSIWTPYVSSGSSSGTLNLVWNFGRRFLEYQGSTINAARSGFSAMAPRAGRSGLSATEREPVTIQ